MTNIGSITPLNQMESVEFLDFKKVLIEQVEEYNKTSNIKTEEIEVEEVRIIEEPIEEIVKELEGGEVPLDEAIEKYTSAMKLAKECSDKLNEVSEKVNKIMLENGKLEDFTVSE